jgi:hypothetical protein
MKIADTLIRLVTFGRFRSRQRPKVVRVAGGRSRLLGRGGLGATGIRRRSRLDRALR